VEVRRKERKRESALFLYRARSVAGQRKKSTGSGRENSKITIRLSHDKGEGPTKNANNLWQLGLLYHPGAIKPYDGIVREGMTGIS